MADKKKIPLRQCVGCCERFPKGELLRVVRTPEGEVVLDFTGRRNGRGVYICKNVKCFSRARKSGKLSQHLETPISEEVYAALEAELGKNS